MAKCRRWTCPACKPLSRRRRRVWSDIEHNLHVDWIAWVKEKVLS